MTVLLPQPVRSSSERVIPTCLGTLSPTVINKETNSELNRTVGSLRKSTQTCTQFLFSTISCQRFEAAAAWRTFREAWSFRNKTWLMLE